MTKNHYSILIAGILSASIAMSANAGTEWEIKVFDKHISFIDINNSGQLLGYDSAIKRYFITGPDGEGISNITEFSNNVTVHAFNDSGQIAGSFLKDGNYHAFITGPNGIGMTDLGTLGGINISALDINESGQVAGSSLTADGINHAFITGPNGIGMSTLDTFGGENSYAFAINESGQVAGSSQTADGIYHAFITGPNGIGMTDLGTLPYDNASHATDINDAAQVVGLSGSYFPGWGFVSQAFITGPNGENMTPLGVAYTDPPKINNSGQAIVNNEHAAFLYSDGVLTMLTGLPIFKEAGFTEIYASGINDKGQILGGGYYRGAAFLLTPISPVPEPSTYAMLLAGLGLMAFRRNRLFKLTNY